MQTGSEIDEQVAEHVFGQKRGIDFGEWAEHDWQRDENGEIDTAAYDSDNHNGPMCLRCHHLFCRWCEQWEPPAEMPEEHRGPCHKSPPPYSSGTGIDWAWLVIKQMRSKGWDCKLEFTAGEGADGWAWARFERHESYYGYEWSADAPAEAICRAALEAMDWDVRRADPSGAHQGAR